MSRKVSIYLPNIFNYRGRKRFQGKEKRTQLVLLDFKQVKGLAATSGMSFEAINWPGYFIRARADQLFIDKFDSALFRAEATFVIVEPQFKLW